MPDLSVLLARFPAHLAFSYFPFALAHFCFPRFYPGFELAGTHCLHTIFFQLRTFLLPRAPARRIYPLPIVQLVAGCPTDRIEQGRDRSLLSCSFRDSRAALFGRSLNCIRLSLFLFPRESNTHHPLRLPPFGYHFLIFSSFLNSFIKEKEQEKSQTSSGRKGKACAAPVPLCTIDLVLWDTRRLLDRAVCVTLAANVSSHEANRRTRVPEVSRQKFSPTCCTRGLVLIALLPYYFSIFIFILISMPIIFDDLTHAHHYHLILLLHHSTPFIYPPSRSSAIAILGHSPRSLQLLPRCHPSDSQLATSTFPAA